MNIFQKIWYFLYFLYFISPLIKLNVIISFFNIIYFLILHNILQVNHKK